MMDALRDGMGFKEQGSDLTSNVRSAYDALMPGADFEVMELCMATVLANRADGDPVSLFLVAPSSTGKSEAVMALSDVPDTYWLSTMNAKTLASGLSVQGKADTAALIHKLPNPGTLLLKEFTSVLSLKPDQRREVVSQLRDMLDGYYRKPHGNGTEVTWKGRIGVIAAVTLVIEQARDAISAMGDRWLLLRVPTGENREETALAALQGTGQEEKHRESLRDAVKVAMQALATPDLNLIRCTEPRQREIAKAVNLMCKLRTPQPRDAYTKEPLYIATPEGPARAAKAAYKLLQCLAIVRGKTEIGDQELQTLRRLVMDNVPSKRRAVLEAMANGATTTGAITNQVGLSSSEVDAALDDLKRFGALTSAPSVSYGRGRPANNWQLTRDAASIFLPKSLTEGG